ncbi:unnamed protein product, partial [Adineta steineri]
MEMPRLSISTASRVVLGIPSQTNMVPTLPT